MQQSFIRTHYSLLPYTFLCLSKHQVLQACERGFVKFCRYRIGRNRLLQFEARSSACVHQDPRGILQGSVMILCTP